MRRHLFTLVLGVTLPAGLFAEDHGPGPGHAQAQALVPVVLDPYRAASPYNIIVLTRNAPNSANNMPNFTLPCCLPNQNLATYVYPECGGGCGWNGGCDSGCGNSCGATFSRHSFGGCSTGCGGCSSGCSGCPGSTPTPAPVVAPIPAAKPVNYIEPISFWSKDKPTKPRDACDSCPPNGPPYKHHMPSAGSLDCTNCTTLESETVFIFGSCRQFFGQPTYHWMHGGR
jgi:hypothetical protein